MATAVGALDDEDTVVGRSGPDATFRGRLIRFTRHAALFEIYEPASPIRLSEQLTGFAVNTAGCCAYQGTATVTSILDTGTCLLCETQLDPQLFTLEYLAALSSDSTYSQRFRAFIEGWRRDSRISPEFKVVIADIVSFLMELRQWTDRMETGAATPNSPPTAVWRRQVLQEIAPTATAALNDLFQRFEHLVGQLEPEARPAHRHYSQPRLHPLVLTAPFAHRAYTKPLGYAGDYAMVSMMLGDPYQGPSLFAQLFNAWLLQQASAAAHRGRIQFLTQQLLATAAEASRRGRRAQIYNLGCGPAREVFEFLAQSPLSTAVDLVLVDFDAQALDFAREALQAQAARYGRRPRFTFLKRSIRDILRDAATGKRLADTLDFDLVYCAGLFDYIAAPTCAQFINLAYRSLRPRGTFLCTNVTCSNPNRGSMELILDWHLIYRDTSSFAALVPRELREAGVVVTTEDTGTNLFLELSKPHGR